MQFTEKDTTAAIVTNTADFDFTPEMGAMYGGRPFPLRKGESLTTNLTVAEHLSKHLAQQILLRGSDVKKDDGSGNGRAIWNPENLEKLSLTFVKVIGQFDVPKQMTKEEILLQNTKMLNTETPDLADAPVDAGYKDKKEVIAELVKRGITYDARSTKATLEKLLA